MIHEVFQNLTSYWFVGIQ